MGLNERAPAGQPVQTKADGDPLAAMAGEDLRGVTVRCPEEGGTRPRQRQTGIPPPAGEQLPVDDPAVGEQALPASDCGLATHEKHEARRLWCAGAFGVRSECTVAESGKARPVRVAACVPDRRQPVRVAVAVRHHTHDSVRERQHRGTRGEAVEGDQTDIS